MASPSQGTHRQTQKHIKKRFVYPIHNAFRQWETQKNPKDFIFGLSNLWASGPMTVYFNPDWWLQHFWQKKTNPRCKTGSVTTLNKNRILLDIGDFHCWQFWMARLMTLQYQSLETVRKLLPTSGLHVWVGFSLCEKMCHMIVKRPSALCRLGRQIEFYFW